MKKFIISEEEKNQIRGLYETETPKNQVDVPKEDIKSAIWNQFKQKPEIPKSLGIDLTKHNEHNFLDNISHAIHAHIDPSTNHMNLEFPNLGKHHNLTLNLGGSFGKHDNSHNDDHNKVSTSMTPHVKFNVGVKYNISNLFNKH